MRRGSAPARRRKSGERRGGKGFHEYGLFQCGKKEQAQRDWGAYSGEEDVDPVQDQRLLAAGVWLELRLNDVGEKVARNHNCEDLLKSLRARHSSDSELKESCQ